MEPSELPTASPDFFRRRFALVLAVILLLGFLFVIRDVMLGAIAGIVLWSMTDHVYQWFLKKFKGRRGAAAASALALTQLVVVVPVIVVVILMIADAATLADRVKDWYAPYHEVVQAQLDRISHGRSIYIFGYELTMRDLAGKIGSASEQIGPALIGMVQYTVGSVFRAGVLLGVAVYTLFFFYLDGPVFLEWVKGILPLEREQSERLLHDFFHTSAATLRTVGIIGVIQGALGGIAFWICGIPAPFFWTVLMAIASAIPAVGCQIVLIPAGVLLILVGKHWAGIALIAWGVIVIAHVDNVLRPYLVGRTVRLHQLLIFLSTLGGIATFGFFGVILGPVIAALLQSVLSIYGQHYGTRIVKAPVIEE